ncbi:MAG: murein L,D-transpeptidase catalytic domain family protein, partial [Parachlamydiaceae bacterium]|nr:murein L,D-transpeptidase catalytic domain family protein [Parachlamydiaceae bacterium]
MHGAPYVGESVVQRYGRIGRSWGCPALPEDMVKPIINTIKNGTLVFAYY